MLPPVDPVDEPAWSTQFLSALVHELRTPLASLLLTAELLADDPRLEPRQARYAKTVGDAAADLRALLDDIGDLNRMRSGRVTIAAAELDLAELLAAAVTPFRRTTQAEGITVLVEVASGTPERVSVDRAHLLRMLQAMVGGALRAGAQRIEVQASAGDGALHIDVRDDGAAPSDADLPRLFEPFAPIGGRTRRTHGGSSLALAVARELAGLLGGTLDAATQEGHTTLRVTLPVR